MPEITIAFLVYIHRYINTGNRYRHVVTVSPLSYVVINSRKDAHSAVYYNNQLWLRTSDSQAPPPTPTQLAQLLSPSPLLTTVTSSNIGWVTFAISVLGGVAVLCYDKPAPVGSACLLR